MLNRRLLTTSLGGEDLAQAFTTGSYRDGYMVTSVSIRMGHVGNAGHLPTAAIYTASGGSPRQEVGTLNPPTSLSANELNTFSASGSGIYLKPDTSYVVVFDSHHDTRRSVHAANTDDDDGGTPGWSIADHGLGRHRSSAGGWNNIGAPHAIRIDGNIRTTPPPLVSNVGQALEGTTDLSANDVAQRFRTGASSHGYRLTSLELAIGSFDPGYAVPEVSIWTANRDLPGRRVGMLVSPGTFLPNLRNTWTTPGIYLAPGTDYFVVIGGGAGVDLELTLSTAEDPETADGWSVVDFSRRFKPKNGDTWQAGQGYVRLQLFGRARIDSTPLQPTTPRVNSDPNAPTSLSASWGAPDNVGAPPITGYDLRYSTDGSTWTDGPQDVTNTSATITDLTEGTAYEVQVRASNASADSAWSASGYGTPGDPVSRRVVGNTGQANEFTNNGNLSTHDIFQPFETGSDPAGYVVTSVDLLFLDVGPGGAANVPQVTIYEEREPSGSGLPGGDGVGVFTGPARLVEGNDGVNTWTSPGIELDPDTTYLLAVELRSGDDAHTVRNTSSFNDDAGGLAGWSIVDNHNIRVRNTSRYDTVQKNLKMRFYGHVFGGAETPTEGTLISNTGQGRTRNSELANFDIAQQFRTGPNVNGYTLTSVAFHFIDVDDTSVKYRASIHTVSGVDPGREVGTLTPPTSLAVNSLNAWTTPGIYLLPNTNYIVVLDSSSGAQNRASATASNSEDTGGSAGWSIGNRGRAKHRVAGVWNYIARQEAYQIKIDGFARASNFPLPPTTPRVSADPLAPTTLSVSWGAPDGVVGGPPLRGYDLRYRVDGDTDWTETDGPQDVTETSATITGLTRGTDYEVQVRASNDHADSRWSASGYGAPGDPASRLMVSTTGQPNDFVSNGNLSTDHIFQTFTTGSSVDGYVVTSVELLFLSVAAARESIVPSVAIYEDSGDGVPGNQVGEIFTAPVRLVASNDGVNTWTNPGVNLNPDTTYVLEVKGQPNVAHVVRNTPSQFNDGGGLEGWSLPIGHLHREQGRSGFDNQLNTLKVRLFGYTDPGLPNQLFALHEDNALPWGIYSHGTTIWVGDRDDNKLYAYTTSGTRLPANDIALAADNAGALGLWGDGETLWVVDFSDVKAYAYDLSTRTADPDNDVSFGSVGSVGRPWGIWSDGETVWVSVFKSGAAPQRVLAYNSARARDSAKDISLYVDPVAPMDPTLSHLIPAGIWSDGFTLWGANSEQNRIYAYDLDSGDRLSDKEFTLASLRDPAGLWWSGSKDAQGGADLLVVDRILKKVFAYPITVDNRPPSFDLPRYERTLLDKAAPGTAAGDPVTADSPDNDPLTYRLGGQDASSLNIDPSTGQIYAKSGVTYDRSVKRYYNVDVTASDGSDSASVQVTIEILPAGVSLSVSPSIVDEDAGEQAVSITATLLGPVRANDVTLSFTLGGTAGSGVHYTTQPDDIPDITITAGDTSGSASFQLRPIDDDERNGPRTVRFNTFVLDPNTSARLPASAVLTIEDDELGPCDPLPISPGVHPGTLTRECYDDYSGGERLYAAYRQYRINLAERTRVMLVLESDLSEHRTVDGNRHTQFDPYLILLKTYSVPGLRPDVIAEYDDIDDSVGNDSAGFIRWLDPGEYIAYATSYSQGVTDVGFTLTYRHEDPNSQQAFVLPGRRSELKYTNYDYLLAGWNTPLPDPETTPQDLGISRNPGKISWYVDLALLDEDDYYRVWWAVSEEKLDGIDDPDRTQRWYTDLRGLDCDQDGRCEYQIPSFDTSKHYVVEVRIIDPVHHTLIAREWYIPPVEPGGASAAGVTAAALAGLTVQPVDGETTQLAVSWDAVTGADKYLVRWRTGTSNYTPGQETTGTAYTIATLLPDTVYTVSVSAIETDADPATELAWGQAVGRTPTEAPEAAALTGLMVGPVTGSDSSLFASWNEVSGASRYVVQWKTEGWEYNAGQETFSAAHVITGLVPGTTYTVRVSAIDGSGAELAAATGTGATSEALWPVTAAAPDGTTGVLDVSWWNVDGAYFYFVELVSEGSLPIEVTPPRTAHRFDGLVEGAAYVIRVQAVSSIRDGFVTLAEGAAIGVTNSSRPSRAEELEGLAVDPVPDDGSRLVVSWDEHGGADEYLVRWKTGPEDYNSGERTVNTSLGISGLEPGTAYSVLVAALDTDTDPDTILVRGEAGGTTAADASPARDEAGETTFHVYHDPNGDADELSRLETAKELLANRNAVYVDTSDRPAVNRLAGVPDSVMPRFFLGDPTDAGWTPVPGTNNGGLRWLRNKIESMPLPNNPATGLPIISGAAQVGQTLTVSTSGIADQDGLDGATFSYQWVANDGSSDADISGATGSAYTLVKSDEGKAVKVKVSFTDDAGNGEALTSAATQAVEAKPNSPAAGQPTISGTAQVGETLTASTSGISDADGLSGASFSYRWLADGAALTGATGSSLTLIAADIGKAISVRVSFTDDGGNAEVLISAATAAVTAADPPANSPATGAPTITGTAKVGETLTADTFGIGDADGLTSASFAYQWLADGTALSGATGATYTPVAGDVGRAISLRVSFTDDGGNAESLTSAATAAVVAADPPADEPDETPAVSFVIYHDPDAGDAAVERYNEAKKLLSDTGLTYSEVTDASQADVDRLAGVTNSVMPRFFLGDPTEDGWTSEPGENNGGLRWLKKKVAELSDD